MIIFIKRIFPILLVLELIIIFLVSTLVIEEANQKNFFLKKLFQNEHQVNLNQKYISSRLNYSLAYFKSLIIKLYEEKIALNLPNLENPKTNNYQIQKKNPIQAILMKLCFFFIPFSSFKASEEKFQSSTEHYGTEIKILKISLGCCLTNLVSYCPGSVSFRDTIPKISTKGYIVCEEVI